MSVDHSKRLSPKEAERAVYLDFESHKEGPPFLAGILVEGEFRQVTFDPQLQTAAQEAPRGTEVATLTEFVDELLSLCETEGRRLVGYSKKELHDIAATGENRLRRARTHYADANKIAKSWMHRAHSRRLAEMQAAVKKQKNRWTKRVGLKDYVATDLVDFDIPKHLRKTSLPTNAARTVRKQLELRGAYARLAKHAKRRWTTLLQYNETDCRAMRALVLTAVGSDGGQMGRRGVTRRSRACPSLPGPKGVAAAA